MSENLPEDERFDLNLPDIAEVWRRGSVISSWLLDLSADALARDEALDAFTGKVADSGEGRWTIDAAMEEAVPAYVLSAALFARYRSRVENTLATSCSRRCASALAVMWKCPSEYQASVVGHRRDPGAQRQDAERGVVAAAGRLQAAGIAMSLISARPPSGMLWIAERLGLTTPVGAFNGGTVVAVDGTVLSTAYVPREVALATLALIDRPGVVTWVFAGGQWIAARPDAEHDERERQSVFVDPVYGGDVTPLLGMIDKIVAVVDDPALMAQVEARVVAEVGNLATVVRSQSYYLDITAHAANKGDGIAALAAAYGVSLDEVAVIGDQRNDMAMFARAGLSIAMAQGPQEVRDAAMMVTLDNDADGVAHAIDTILPMLAH
jgi:Cof subfamily protein (haloacid dehalogenase superfamily)